MPAPSETVNLLKHNTLFLHVATPDDIEAERTYLEALHRERLEAFEVEIVTRSGARCTRVTWKCL